MGFDFTAKDRTLGDKGYFRVTVDHIILLRSAMVAAGVNENLIYRKFVSNDGQAITAIRSRHIAECLATWLKGRSLMVDLCERNPGATDANEAYVQVALALGNKGTQSRVRRFLKRKPVPFKIDSLARKQIREFAEFCRRSGGFRID